MVKAKMVKTKTRIRRMKRKVGCFIVKNNQIYNNWHHLLKVNSYRYILQRNVNSCISFAKARYLPLHNTFFFSQGEMNPRAKLRSRPEPRDSTHSRTCRLPARRVPLSLAPPPTIKTNMPMTAPMKRTLGRVLGNITGFM